MNQLIDTHVHLDRLDRPLEAAAEARLCQVASFVIPGIRPEGWPDLLRLAEQIPGAWAAPGIHPLAARTWTPDLERQLLEAAQHPKAVAIGEVGLDRQAEPSQALQEETFRHMIRLARELDLPLLLHVRRAVGRLLAILQEEQAAQVGGIFHAFSGSLEVAQQAIDLGFALGVGGVVTFPTARRLPEVVRQVPAEWLVLETDAPDQTPHPCRGEPNRPALLPLIAREVARLRNWSLEETARISSDNATRVLRLPAQSR